MKPKDRVAVEIMIFCTGVLGGVIFAVSAAYFGGYGGACVEGEKPAICIRAWIELFGTAAVVASIGFLIWQIIVTRKQLLLPAIVSLNDMNETLQNSRRAIMIIQVFCRQFVRACESSTLDAVEIENIINTFREQIREGLPIFDVAMTPLPEKLNDEILELFISFNTLQENLENVAEMIADSLLIVRFGGSVPAELSVSTEKLCREIAQECAKIHERAKEIRNKMHAIYNITRRRLYSMHKSVGEEIDRVTRAYHG